MNPRRIYLDGNSLGPPQPGVLDAMRALIDDEWATDLIGGWNAHGWWELPLTVGDRIAPLVGAAPGQVVVHWPLTRAGCSRRQRH